MFVLVFYLCSRCIPLLFGDGSQPLTYYYHIFGGINIYFCSDFWVPRVGFWPIHFDFRRGPRNSTSSTRPPRNGPGWISASSGRAAGSPSGEIHGKDGEIHGKSMEGIEVFTGSASIIIYKWIDFQLATFDHWRVPIGDLPRWRRWRRWYVTNDDVQIWISYSDNTLPNKPHEFGENRINKTSFDINSTDTWSVVFLSFGVSWNLGPKTQPFHGLWHMFFCSKQFWEN